MVSSLIGDGGDSGDDFEEEETKVHESYLIFLRSTVVEL